MQYLGMCEQNKKYPTLLCESAFYVFVDVQGCPDGKLQAERIAALQERKQALEALLSTRVGELKQVCLQEAVCLSHCTFKAQLHFCFELPVKDKVEHWNTFHSVNFNLWSQNFLISKRLHMSECPCCSRASFVSMSSHCFGTAHSILGFTSYVSCFWLLLI